MSIELVLNNAHAAHLFAHRAQGDRPDERRQRHLSLTRRRAVTGSSVTCR
jgi:hypothetical protein